MIKILSADCPIHSIVRPKNVHAILLMAMKTAMAQMVEESVKNLLVGCINLFKTKFSFKLLYINIEKLLSIASFRAILRI